MPNAEMLEWTGTALSAVMFLLALGELVARLHVNRRFLP